MNVLNHKQPLLMIRDLHVAVEGNEILKGINLTIKPGELHAIMGRNGSGKSTLANVIAGREPYEITGGEIHYKGKDIRSLAPEQRALEGIFMSFQYPVVIPGVNNAYFLRTALNTHRKHQGKKELNAAEFLRLIREKLQLVQMEETYLSRAVNDGFSGGEKKRNEILQMLTLEPTLSILDETDSGLDIDALKIVAEGVNQFRNPDRAFIAITHYKRLLDYMKPDFIHVLIDGKIVLSGGPELASELEQRGYAWLEEKPQ
jgi:Fe-S cluster assembly ATP-binding protein